VVNGVRLAQQLALQEGTSVFTESGELQPEVTAESHEIVPGEDLGNKAPGRLRLIPPRLAAGAGLFVQVSASSVRRPRCGGCDGVAVLTIGASHGR
jgi:hypothetical protein